MSGQALDLRRSARIVWRLKAWSARLSALGFLGGGVVHPAQPGDLPGQRRGRGLAVRPITSQAPVVTSPPVLAAALAGVDRGVPAASLGDRIQVGEAALGLMSIMVKDDNARQAIDTANVVARSYVSLR